MKRILKLIYIHTLGLMMMMIISSPSSSLFLTVREEGKGVVGQKFHYRTRPHFLLGSVFAQLGIYIFGNFCENINILGLLHSQMFTYFAIPPGWYISRKEFALMGLCVSPAFKSFAVNPMQCFCKTSQTTFLLIAFCVKPTSALYLEK